MSLFKTIFGKEEKVEIHSYQDFWDWFQQNEKNFYEVLKSDKGVDKKFLDLVHKNLEQLHKGYDLVAEMKENVAELIFTVHGNIENIVFAEDLVKSAPAIPNWHFVALIPEQGEGFEEEVNHKNFNEKNIYFYPSENPDFADETDLTFVYSEPLGKNRDAVSEGISEFLKNYLGELKFATQIDSFSVIENHKAEKDLIPVTELKAYLENREKDFSEKHKGSLQEVGSQLGAFEVFAQNGFPVRLLLNVPLLRWQKRFSYPWISVLKIGFSPMENGLPEQGDFDFMNEIDEQMKQKLTPENGHLYIGRETYDGTREVYFASKDFRETARVFDEIIKKYGEEFTFTTDIFKDKYWKYFVKYNLG